MESERTIAERVVKRYVDCLAPLNIDGNEIKYYGVNITNMQKNEDNEYICNGSVRITDVYGKHYYNKFDAKVYYSESSQKWLCDFDYKDEWHI